MKRYNRSCNELRIAEGKILSKKGIEAGKGKERKKYKKKCEQEGGNFIFFTSVKALFCSRHKIDCNGIFFNNVPGKEFI